MTLAFMRIEHVVRAPKGCSKCFWGSNKSFAAIGPASNDDKENCIIYILVTTLVFDNDDLQGVCFRQVFIAEVTVM